MNALRLALRQLRREWRSGELAILVIGLVLAVSALSSVNFLTERVLAAVNARAGESLAADLVIQSRREIPASFAALGRDHQLSIADTLTFASVVTTDSAAQLAEIRATSPGYPLRGQLKVSERAFGESRAAQRIPAPGEAWVEPRLLGALGIQTGDTVQVGNVRLNVTQIIDHAPDQGFSFAELAPMLLMNEADIAATGLIGPASRVTYRLLMAGDAGNVAAARTALEAELDSTQRLLDVRDGRPELANAIERADRFLGLAALVSVLLAGIAIAMSARQYVVRENDAVAILKCLGATRRTILFTYVAQLLILAMVAGLLGIALGYGAQALMVELFKDFIGQELPAASLASVPAALALGVIILAGFGLPPVLGLVKSSPLRVLRHDDAGLPRSAAVVYGSALLAIISLLTLQIGDTELASYVLGGAAAGAVILALGAWLLIKGLSSVRQGAGIAWRFGIANIVRRGRNSIVQVMAFGLGMLVLLLLAVVRTDLLASWQASLPENAANYFLINIQPAERDSVTDWLESHRQPAPKFSALVRARMSRINDQPVSEIEFTTDRAQRFAEREANLTWLAELPASNEIVAGEWWTAEQHDAPLVSLEVEAAERLGVGVGDRLSYDIAGEEITVTIASLRRIDWDSFEPNFFVAFPPGLLTDYPQTFISSLYLPREQSELMLGLIQRHPSITVIDLDSIITQVRSVMDQAALAVEYVFLFTLAAGVLVLLAAVQASRDERRFESAMLRTLGASRSNVMKGVLAEFMLLGLLASLLGVVVAAISGWLLATQVFNLDYSANILLWLIALILGTLWVSATGYLATRQVVQHPPLSTLRKR